MLAVGDMVSRQQAQCLMPSAWSLYWLLLFFPVRLLPVIIYTCTSGRREAL